MVKFGRPRGKLEDERRREFLRKSVEGGGRDGGGGRGTRKGEGQREKFYETGHGWTEESSGREDRRETRDKETNIDNEENEYGEKGGTKEVREDER